ncbi:MAG: hypothetical protein N2Z84_03435 [Atribacterota bacterium]|nr:hypothetical protein [Atribacterota bacterium]
MQNTWKRIKAAVESLTHSTDLNFWVPCGSRSFQVFLSGLNCYNPDKKTIEFAWEDPLPEWVFAVMCNRRIFLVLTSTREGEEPFRGEERKEVARKLLELFPYDGYLREIGGAWGVGNTIPTWIVSPVVERVREFLPNSFHQWFEQTHTVVCALANRIRAMRVEGVPEGTPLYVVDVSLEGLEPLITFEDEESKMSLFLVEEEQEVKLTGRKEYLLPFPAVWFSREWRGWTIRGTYASGVHPYRTLDGRTVIFATIEDDELDMHRFIAPSKRIFHAPRGGAYAVMVEKK